MCVGYSYPERKDMSDVSFVGIYNINNGLIAFADSKATLNFSDGHKEKDRKRGEISKIFKNDRFIFVTHGNNTIFPSYREKNIEDWINANLKKKDEIQTFFDRFFKTVKADKATHHDGIYKFYVGSKDSQGYFTQMIDINCSKEEIIISNKDYDKKRIIGGAEKYVNLFLTYTKLYYDKPITDMMQDVRIQVESIIDIFDTQADYNSVGKPVQIEIYQ